MPSPKGNQHGKKRSKAGSGSGGAAVNEQKDHGKMIPTAGGSAGGGVDSSTAVGSSKSNAKKLPSSSIETYGLLDYMYQTLSRKTLQSLYMDDNKGQYVCRAVLQQLNRLYQQIIIRLNCTGGSFLLSNISQWTCSMNQQQMNSMLKELHKWAIIQDYSSNNNNTSTDTNTTLNNTADVEISLTIPFAKGLRTALCSLESSPWIPLTDEQIEQMKQQQLLNNDSLTKEQKNTIHKLKLPTPDDLEHYTQNQWDIVLHYLVGTVNSKEPSPAVVHFLLKTGLMQPDLYDNKYKNNKSNNPDDAPLVITTKGYDFMLQDNYQQVWHFIVQYLQSVIDHSKSISNNNNETAASSSEKIKSTTSSGGGSSSELYKNALLLLICLTYTKVGYPYLSNTLKKDNRTMIKDLTLFGLLYTIKIGKMTIFYPTRLALQIIGTTNNNNNTSNNNNTASSTSDSSTLWSLSTKVLEASLNQSDPSSSSHLAIIVQTNFQLAAYTTNELHVSMLGLFCGVSTIRRLPNVVFMQMTRDSVKSAFALGIHAKQIIRFLEKHTHPTLRSNSVIVQGSTPGSSPIPSNVIDQIWLWDRELHRVQFTKVYQHQCIMGINEYNAIIQYVTDKNIYNYNNERKLLLLLDYNHIERIQAYIRQWRSQTITRERHQQE